MRIEAVVTCVNYSDFLEHTLIENLQHVDTMVVVSSTSDTATKSLCDKLGVDLIDSDVFYEKGDKFNKARGINLGLQHLRHDGWLLHLDADILLPHRFRTMLEHARLNPQNIYGADRVNVHGYDEWVKYRHKIKPQYRYRYLVDTPSEFPLGTRIIHLEYGYCPIGYFQLWHSSQRRKYPINQGSAEHTDLLFSVQWPRERRILLPELFVFHLESEKSEMGKNWKGRASKPFAPEKKK